MATNVCEDCPFLRWRDEELGPRRAYAEQGGWIPCRLTAADIREDQELWSRVEAWKQEKECFGARAWRRDRRRPVANGT